MLENNFWRENSNCSLFKDFLLLFKSVNIESWVSTKSTIIPLDAFFAGLAKASNNQLSLLKKKLSWKMELKLFCSSYPFRRNWIYQVCLLLWYWIFNLDKYFVSLMNDFLTHPLQGKYVSLHNRNSVTSSLIKE